MISSQVRTMALTWKNLYAHDMPLHAATAPIALHGGMPAAKSVPDMISASMENDDVTI